MTLDHQAMELQADRPQIESHETLPSYRVFVLGDSRTGTLSLHNFFLNNGLSSLHYFVEEAEQKEPLHEHMEENERNFLAFLKSSDVQCYTDYPTRFYYRQLLELYPEAYFILTRRSDADRWTRSMQKFFAHFGHAPNLEALRANYELQNESIRRECRERHVKFLEICIDDDNETNSERIATFLGLGSFVPIGHDNASASIDNGVLSSMHQLFSFAGDITPDVIESNVAPSKSIISEFGWIFLVNDTNKFLKVQFGGLKWSDEDRSKAVAVINDRVKELNSRGATYYKFIIPEKNVVYSEYLPRVLASLPKAESRPAHDLQRECGNTVYYLDRYLSDAKSYGQLYFRGDSHTNWLGAWLVYCFVIRQLSKDGAAKLSELLKYADLIPSLASYEGDLASQLDPRTKKEFDDRWGFTNPRYGFDVTVKLDIPNQKRKAFRIETPERYAQRFPSRETVVHERPDGQGLKAVVFRDSTLDFCHDLLAQHFSRSVFIWHQGQVYENVIEEEKPDIVLHIMAERFVTKYPTFVPIVRK